MSPSIGLSVDAQSSEPLYRQIFDQVVDRVRTGAFPEGFRLPPTRSLARHLGTHRNTVVRAYEDLEAAGFVESTVGRGTFVARRLPSRPAPGGQARGELSFASLFSRNATAESLGRMDRLTRALRPGQQTGDAINMNRMQPSPDLIPDELIRRCVEHVLRTQGARILGYADRPGVPKLRALIARDLERQGVPATADDIVVTSGSQQALDVVARALVNPGDAFLVNSATYHGAMNVLASAGARLVPVPSDDEGPSMDALDRLSRAGAKGFYLMPNAHNPTGLTISEPRRDALVAWSRRAGVPLIEDDYVADLVLDDGPHPSALRARDADVIYIGTFSKRLAPAFRVGFLVCPAALRPRAMQLKHTMDLGNSELLQHALAEFLERGYLEAHLARILPIYRDRRDALERALGRYLPRGVAWRRPSRGVALWLPLSVDPQAVFEEAQRRGVLVYPSTLNEVEEGSAGGIRLTFCSEPPPRLAEGARRLGKALGALLGVSPAPEPADIGTI
ncbi:MAG TPA: PLP-dependent aminotransferase family protein [Haliangiales bacterium]|nr:PLP-dependent aminotransferase family protein [Haliangiales bacterium]